MLTTPEWDFPQLLTGARTVNFLLVIDLFMASSAGPWLQVPISREEKDSNCWPTPQQVQKSMHFPGRREDEGVNQIEGSQRGVF